MRSALTVIDEPRVRKFLESALQKEGFQVLPAAACVQPTCPDDCILDCCDGARVPDLAVFEVLVPRACCGIEAAHKALGRWPNVKIVVTSASSSDLWPADAASLLYALPADACVFLQKPFTLQQLREALRSLFGERAAAALTGK